MAVRKSKNYKSGQLMQMLPRQEPGFRVENTSHYSLHCFHDRPFAHHATECVTTTYRRLKSLGTIGEK